MKKTWWKESVIYQIYPRSFADSNGDGIGDINGITSKLDYLRNLGIDVIWLSPVYKSPNDDNGYDISDYEAIMDEFGTMEDFDRMLDEAHARGIKIVMDLVVNHTSDEHKWFLESRSSKDNPKRDYYFWREGKDGKEPNNWGSWFSGSAWKYDETTDMYYLHLFSPKQPDLNWDNPAVRKDVFDMMTRWCEKGIDGFRMDVISLISKPAGLPDAPLMNELEMNRKVLSKFDIMTVGETACVTLEEAKKYANSEGTELNMVFQFEHVGLDGDEQFKWSTRKMPNRLGDPSDEYREVSAKCIATCLHMMQGTPYVYQGEELGMVNYPFRTVKDFNDLESINAYYELTEKMGWDPKEIFPKIANKSRDNARTPMQWDDSPNAGFTTGKPWLAVNPNYTKINAAEQVIREDSVFNYYKKLIELRHTYDIIVYGHYELQMAEDPELYIYTRELDGHKLLVVCNFSDHEREFMPDEEFREGKVLIRNLNNNNILDGILEPYEAYVIYAE